MSTRELKRVYVVQQALEKRIKQEKAAELLELSTRQIKRLVRRLKKEGPCGIIHKLRGRKSNRKHPEKLRERVIQLYKKHYLGFGPTLAQEKLSERNQIRIGRETLRRWLLEGGDWEPRKKGHKHREWRERKASFGEMIQMDGSHHDWLEGRGPKFVLMGYIDDATGNVFARFYDYEGTFPAMESFQRYVTRYGLPQSVYLDKHSTYQSPAQPRWAKDGDGKKPQSQFERALETLGVRVIHADSPQAKGRVERLFGVFQDRLVKEMRLERIKTQEGANHFLIRYLSEYNRRFRKAPANAANLHRPLPKRRDLKHILSIQKRRTLRNDNTIHHEKKLYLIENSWKGKRPREILTEERLDGRLHLLDENRELRFREVKEAPRATPQPRPRRFYPKPPVLSLDHPWRKFLLPGSPRPDKKGTLLTSTKGDISNGR